ncbi:MAG: hypothetical protein QXK54_06395 [Ignisphaera sp.]
MSSMEMLVTIIIVNIIVYENSIIYIYNIYAKIYGSIVKKS